MTDDTSPLDRRPPRLEPLAAATAPPQGAWSRPFRLWESRPTPGASWWRRLLGWWRRRSASTRVVLDHEGVRVEDDEDSSQHTALRWDEPWLAQLSAWPISPHYLELGIVLVRKGGDARAQARRRTALRVVLPQRCVSGEVPVQQRADPFLDTGDFERLWSLLCAHAQLHGYDLGEQARAPRREALPRWDVAGGGAPQLAPPPRRMAETVTVPAGTYTIGSPPNEPRRDPDERRHAVRLTRSFVIEAAPVTNARWEAVMGGSPPSRFSGAGRPVEQVSWFSAVAYCNALSRRQGLDEAYVLTEVRGEPGEERFWARVRWKGLDCDGWRLPTEAEWEIACRAGTLAATWGLIGAIAWTKDNSGGQTHPVGLKVPNAWGLYDTLGNVWEWVWDRYGPYGKGEVVDPVGPREGRRTIRGGCWNNFAHLARCANRGFGDPDIADPSIGFRCARTVPGPGPSAS